MMLDFDKIYSDYKREIYYYLTRKSLFLIRSEIIQELTNDVFLKVYFALDTYDDTYSIRTWLYKIADNILIDYYRKKKLTTVPLDTVSEIQVHENIESVLDNEDSLNKALNKILALDKSLRDIALMYFWEGRKQLAIAKTYNVPKFHITYKIKLIKEKLKL